MFLLAFGLGLLLAATAAAQVCTVEEAPEFRGLKLGMTRKKFMAKFPGTDPINMFDRDELSRVHGFSGLERLVFRINNDNLKLDQLEVHYAGLSGGAERLKRRLSKEFALPIDAWKPEADKLEMRCLTFRITADPATNGFTITDLAGEKYWIEMKEAAERGRN